VATALRQLLGFSPQSHKRNKETRWVLSQLRIIVGIVNIYHHKEEKAKAFED